MSRVSIKDVAKAAGVSQAAVSRVLNNSGYISDEKREIVHRVIRELDYRPNALARSLVKSKSKTIGLCIPYMDSPFISNLMDGVEGEAEKHGYDIFISHTRENPEVERNAMTRMLDRQVDGIIVAPVLGGKSCIGEFMRIVPTVMVLRKPKNVDQNLVLADDYNATRTSFSHLLEKGHRRIGVVSGPAEVSTMSERWRAILDTLTERGMKVDMSLVVNPGFNYQKSYEAAKQLLNVRKRPTAIYSTHYWASSALLSLLYDLGLSIPEDISAVAYESFEDWNLISKLKFATNIFPANRMGCAAMAELHKLISSNQLYMSENITLQPEFFPHHSVKDLRPAARRRETNI